MECTVDNCEKKIYAREWCRNHYRHVVEYGHCKPLPIYYICQTDGCKEALPGKANHSGLCRTHYMEKWKNETNWDLSAYQKSYRENNKVRIAANIKKWKSNNRKQQNTWYTNKRKDPHYRLAHNQRSRLYDALKGKIKHKSTFDLVGCEVKELMDYLEVKFQKGMSWDNYGTYWVVDHIKPMIAFNLEIPEQLEKACHYSNLQPLTHADNSAKATEDKKWKS